MQNITILKNYQKNNNFSEAIQADSTINSIVDNIMIRESLTSIFKKPIWSQISRVQPHIFILQQNGILRRLLAKEQYFDAFFTKFYKNHANLFHWYSLASEKHHEMRKYVFSSLLKGSIIEYKQIMKQKVQKNRSNIQKKQVIDLDISQYCMRKTPDSPKKIVRNESISSKQKFRQANHENHILKSINRNLDDILNQIPFKQISNSTHKDYHALFVQTLEACDGNKYIHYDFKKHQKGYENRLMYNQFIRVKPARKISKISIQTQGRLYPSIPRSSDQIDKSIISHFSKTQNGFSKVQSTTEDLKNSKQLKPLSFHVQSAEDCKLSDDKTVCNQNKQVRALPKSKFGKEQKHLLNNYSSFELTSMGINNKTCKKWNEIQQQKKKNLHQRKMPHQFNKQRLSSNIKIQNAKFAIVVR